MQKVDCNCVLVEGDQSPSLNGIELIIKLIDFKLKDMIKI